MEFSKVTRQNSTSFQSLQCYKNGTCTRWHFALRLYTSHYIAPSCGHLLVTSRHCHAHVATLSRALCSLLQTGLQPLRECLAGLLTILEALNKPFRGVSKIATDSLRQCTDVSSILCHLFATGRPSCTTVT